MRYEDSLGCTLHDQHPPFNKPSYLRKNRFVERLEAEYNAHLLELVDGRDDWEVLRPKRSAGSHRGVAQDVAERSPAGLLSGPHAHTEDSGLRRRGLPTRWNEDDKWTGLEVIGDGTELRFSGVCKTSDEAASIRTDYPIPIECGIYYFEITIMSKCKEGLIGIGFSGKKTSLNRLPGWENDSWAYHGDDGYIFSQSANGKSYGPKFATLDVIGCGVNFRTGKAFFTRNGVNLGELTISLASHFSISLTMILQALPSMTSTPWSCIRPSELRNRANSYAPISAANGLSSISMA